MMYKKNNLGGMFMFAITLAALMVTFSFTILVEIIEKITMKGRTVGEFHSFENSKNTKVPTRICYKYEVNGETYYFTTENYTKESDGKNTKIKLMYNTSKPSKAALDSGYASLIIQVVLLGLVLVIKHYLVA